MYQLNIEDKRTMNNYLSNIYKIYGFRMKMNGLSAKNYPVRVRQNYSGIQANNHRIISQ